MGRHALLALLVLATPAVALAAQCLRLRSGVLTTIVQSARIRRVPSATGLCLVWTCCAGPQGFFWLVRAGRLGVLILLRVWLTAVTKRRGHC